MGRMGSGTILNLAGPLDIAEMTEMEVGIIETTPATATVRATNSVTPSVTGTSMDTGTGIGSRRIIAAGDTTSVIDIRAGGEQKIHWPRQRRVTDSKGAEGIALSASVTRRLSLFTSSDDRQRRI
jgi:hypothetical protein